MTSANTYGSHQIHNMAVRIISICLASNNKGERFYNLRLGYADHEYDAVLPLTALPYSQQSLAMGDIVFVSGSLQPESMGVLFITNIKRIELQYAPAETLLPMAFVATRAEPELSSFYRAVRSITDPTLKLFVGQVFSDWRVASAFGQNPASTSHHHAFPGGLLMHSLDVAKRAWRFAKDQQEPIQYEVVVVLALLHDIGKVLTFDGSTRCAQGHWQCTDMSALQVLNDALITLDEYDSNVAHLIRSFYQPETWYPRSAHPVVVAVRNGDRGSLGV